MSATMTRENSFADRTLTDIAATLPGATSVLVYLYADAVRNRAAFPGTTPCPPSRSGAKINVSAHRMAAPWSARPDCMTIAGAVLGSIRVNMFTGEYNLNTSSTGVI